MVPRSAPLVQGIPPLFQEAALYSWHPQDKEIIPAYTLPFLVTTVLVCCKKNKKRIFFVGTPISLLKNVNINQINVTVISINVLGSVLFLISSLWDFSLIFRNTSPAGVLREFSRFSKINESYSFFSKTHCIQLSWILLIGWTTSGIEYKSVIGRSNRVLPMKW